MGRKKNEAARVMRLSGSAGARPWSGLEKKKIFFVILCRFHVGEEEEEDKDVKKIRNP